jgi:hypothetical protein
VLIAPVAVEAAFASKLTASERTDVAHAMTYPTGTKILLLQLMLAMIARP